jgi:hypothetical protein
MTAIEQRILENPMVLPSEDECITQWGQMSRSALADLNTVDLPAGFDAAVAKVACIARS